MHLANADTRKFQQRVIDKARQVMEHGKPVKLKYHRYQHEKELYKIDMGFRYRLVSSDRVEWFLMYHEQYNRIFK